MVSPPGPFYLEDFMKVIVDINTLNDFVGDSRDHAVVVIDDRLRERIRAFHRALANLSAHYISEFENSPDFNFVSPDTRYELVQLEVAYDGDFRWRGYLKDTDTLWQTGWIPLALLDQPDDSEHDLREHLEDYEDDEEPDRFINRYRHCGQEWEGRWSSSCNDRCPVCNAEIEPYESEEIGSEEAEAAECRACRRINDVDFDPEVALCGECAMTQAGGRHG
jgi:hypothetical protein